ncbi:unnamed protein product [Rhizoctonia solani]|uniref:Uncharacterized protein n=1 Tax=Rhizoctonia solani TaxID=456999 RepID=A0A8H3DTX7_9AGAM|nr:unnamed protein product [Rhizoctonia solani]
MSTTRGRSKPSAPEEDPWYRDIDARIEQYIREDEEEQEKIRTNPQAAKKALVRLKQELNKYGNEQRFNYDDFATHTKDGKVRSEAEQDRFLVFCDQRLDYFQDELGDISTHNDSDLEGLGELIRMGIDNYRGKVTAATNRTSR